MSQNNSYELFADNGLFSPCNLTDNGRTGNTEEKEKKNIRNGNMLRISFSNLFILYLN